MAYNLRDRKSLAPTGRYNEESSNGSDDEHSNDSTTHDDQDYMARGEARRFRIKRGRGGGRTGQRQPGRPPRPVAGDLMAERLERWKRLNLCELHEEPFMYKRTIFSWLISKGIIVEGEKVCYIDKVRGLQLLTGKINREGINCDCCHNQLTVDQFEYHARGETGKPYKNVYLMDVPLYNLLDCQKLALEDKDERKKYAYSEVKPKEKATDKYDDTCIVCADGGDLICCDRCPSTYHSKCVFMQNVPEGAWLCPYCVCKYCASGSGALSKCLQCDKLFHSKCGGEILDLNNSSSLFCGNSCRGIHAELERLVGVQNEVSNSNGLYWTVLKHKEQSFDFNEDDDQYSAIVTNSKVSVASQLMNDCFPSTRDRYTRSNIVECVVYSRGSSFNRLNFSGFYTMVLERRDEIICAASFRVHGKNLAELPFFGTRKEYRGLGMARMLFNCIESVFGYLSIEKLVLPSVQHLVEMWVDKFLFSPIEDEGMIQELSQLNTVMFPNSVVRLGKSLEMVDMWG